MSKRHLVGGFRAAVFTDDDRLGKLRNAQDPNSTEVKENHTECTDTVTEHLFTNTRKKKGFFSSTKKFFKLQIQSSIKYMEEKFQA